MPGGEGISQNLKTGVKNKFPDCVRMDLLTLAPNGNEFGLVLDLNFADEWCDLETKKWKFLKEHWRVRFGIAGGELCLELTNLLSPTDKRNFRQALPTAIEGKRRQREELSDSHTQGDTIQIGGQVSGKEDALSVGYKGEDKHSTARKKEVGHEFSVTKVMIHEKGEETKPKWSIRSQEPGAYLEGSLREQLASFTVTNRPYGLTAKFTTSFQSVHIEEVDSPKFSEQTMKRQAVLKLMMQKYLYAAMKEYVSKVDCCDVQ